MLKALGVALPCSFSIGVFLAIVVPAASLLFGFGIETPNVWPGFRNVLFLYSHLWVPLLVGILLLTVCGWAVWKLTKA